MIKTYKGKKAKKLLNKMIDDFADVIKNNPKSITSFKYMPLCKGFFKDVNAYKNVNVYVAFDNSAGDCYCEEFKSKKEANKFLRT